MRSWFYLIISTHDLARRSTFTENAILILLDYFNSRPRKEVDDVRSVVMEYFTAFQLTTSQGGRHILLNRNTLLRCISTHDLARRSTLPPLPVLPSWTFQLTTSQGGRQQFLRKKFSFQNHFLCSLHIIYSYYINIVFFSTLFLAKSSFFLVRIH